MWRTVGRSGLGCFSWLICGGRWNPQSFHWNCCRSKRLLEVKHLELTLLIIQYISWSILNCMNNLKIIFLYDNSKNILQIYTSSLHINASDHATFAKHCAISYHLWGHRPRSKRLKSSKTPILKLHWSVFHFLLPEIGTSTSCPSPWAHTWAQDCHLYPQNDANLWASVSWLDINWLHIEVSRLLCHWHPLSLPRNCHGQAPNLIPFPM